ncbi:MAG: oligosaccharide flippase family protein [Betaproteobacteria bacterium]
MRKILQGFFIYGAGDFLARLISFFGFLFLARVLSKSDYGLVESYIVTIGLMGTISAAGLNNALQAYFYSKNEFTQLNESERISTAFFTLLAFQAAVYGLVIFFSVIADISVSFELVLLMATISALTVQFQLLQDVFRLRFQPFKYLVSTMLSKAGSTIVSVTLVFMGFGINGYFWGYAIALLVSFLLLSLFLHEIWSGSVNLKLAQSLLRYGLPFIVVGLGSWIFTSLDRWLLASFSGLSAVGEYAFAVRISFLVSFLSLAFGQAWSPMVFKLKESRPKDYLSIYADSFLAFTLVIAMLAAAISVFSYEFQKLFFADKYKESLLAILLLCFAAVVQSTTSFTAIGISLSRKTRYFAAFTWLAAGISLFGNSILIPQWGVDGAALMSLCSTCVLTILYFWISQKQYRLHFMKNDVILFIVLMVYLLVGSSLLVWIGASAFGIYIKVGYLTLALVGLILFLRTIKLKYAQ